MKLIKKVFIVIVLSIVTGTSSNIIINGNYHKVQASAKSYYINRTVKINKNGYSIWRDVNLRHVKGKSNSYLNKSVVAKYLCKTRYGWYYKIYFGKHFLGYMNPKGTAVLSTKLIGQYFNKKVKIIKNNYRVWNDLNFHKAIGNTKGYVNQTVTAKNIYNTKYGAYYSIYQNNSWKGYLGIGATDQFSLGDPFYDPDYDPNLSDPNSIGYHSMNHKISNMITVTDVDSIGQKPVNSKFKLEDNEGNVIKTGTTNNGKLVWTNVRDAYYSVHEVSAQKGYERLHIARAANLNNRNITVNFRDRKVTGNEANTPGKPSLTRMIKYAESLIGTPYYLGNRPGYLDCSSFVQKVFQNATGVSLPRTTYYQYPFAPKINSQLQAKAGDLVFFHENSSAQKFYIDHHESEMDYAKEHPNSVLTKSMFNSSNPDWSVGHVGIYLGNGQMIDCQVHGGVIINPIHAPWWNVAGFNRPVSNWNP